MAPNVIIQAFNFPKVDHLNYWTAPKWKHLCWLSTWRLFLSHFFIVSIPFSIQLPERHNREKEKFQKNLFLSNFYQKTNLKQVMTQNSSCCFVNFHVFFVWSFFTRKKDWNKFLAKLHVSLRTNDLSPETLCWKGKRRLLHTALNAFLLHSTLLKNH